MQMILASVPKEKTNCKPMTLRLNVPVLKPVKAEKSRDEEDLEVICRHFQKSAA